MTELSTPSAKFSPRLSHPEKSRLILVSTAGTITTVLALWLVWWFSQDHPGAVFSAFSRPAGASVAGLTFQPEDALQIGSGIDPRSRQTETSRLLDDLAKCLETRKDVPVVIYLSAAGIEQGSKAVLVPDDPGDGPLVVNADARAVDIKAIFDLLESKSPSPKLLILDAGQVGSDWDLGVFGNGFVQKVVDMMEGDDAPEKVAVLLSCAPGQTSWASEAERRSVFGYFVARGMSGEVGGGQPLTVKALHRYVAGAVESWVKVNRKARQTPLLLGDSGVNFSINPPTPARRRAAKDATEAGGDGEKSAREKLAAGWSRRDEVERQYRPHRRSPMIWRQYLDRLLRAEREFRAGRFAESEKQLEPLAGLEAAIVERASGWKVARPWSLAAAESMVRGNPSLTALKDEAEKARNDLKRTAEGLTGRIASLATPKIGGEAKSKDSGGGGLVSPLAMPNAIPDSLLKPGNASSPRYVEAQLLLWADAYDRLPGRISFREDRGAQLWEAIQVRSLSDDAADNDDRTQKWIAPRIEEADAQRREAQDALFSDSPQRAEKMKKLQAARALYAEAREAAITLGDALDLLNRIAVEMPYFADWQGTRPASDPSYEALWNAAGELANQMRAVAEIPARATSADAVGKAFVEDVHLLNTRVEVTQNAYTTFRKRLDSAIDRSREGEGPIWRELDGYLRVPTLSAGRRADLLKRVGSKLLSPALGEGDGTEDFALIDDEKAARAKTSESKRKRKAARKEDPDSPDDHPVADPNFLERAATLAKLEILLAKVGGASDADVHALEQKFDLAWTPPTGKAKSFAEFSAFAREVRERSRQKLMDRTEGFENLGNRLALAADAAKILPVGTLPATMEAGPERRLDQYLRFQQMRFQARRLERDFAASQAVELLKEAREVATSGDTRLPVDLAGPIDDLEKQARAGFSLAVVPPADRIEVGGGTSLTKLLALTIAAAPEVPMGEATLLIGNDASRLRLVEKGRESANVEAHALAVGPSAAGRIDLEMSRPDFDQNTSRMPLRPRLFYRGRDWALPREVTVVLNPNNEPIQVSMREINTPYRDQFLDHPREGYLHYGTTLACELVFQNTTDKPLLVKVSAEMEGAEKRVEGPVTLPPKGKKPYTIPGCLFAVDTAEGKGEVKQPKFDYEITTRTRTLKVNVLDAASGTPLCTERAFYFRQLEVEEYAEVVGQWDPMQGRYRVLLTHRTTDKVNRPLTIAAAHVAGRTWGMENGIKLTKGLTYEFWFEFPQPPVELDTYMTIGYKPRAFPDKYVNKSLKAAAAAAPPQ